MSGGYYACGKQVLWGNTGIADARDPETADLIVDALNAYRAPTYRDAIMPELSTAPAVGNPHNVRQESDEYACSCGARWDTSEGSDHP